MVQNDLLDHTRHRTPLHSGRWLSYFERTLIPLQRELSLAAHDAPAHRNDLMNEVIEMTTEDGEAILTRYVLPEWRSISAVE